MLAPDAGLVVRATSRRWDIRAVAGRRLAPAHYGDGTGCRHRRPDLAAGRRDRQTHGPLVRVGGLRDLVADAGPSLPALPVPRRAALGGRPDLLPRRV